MGKFEQEAKDLLQAIGGKDNITAVTHCATRMRFVLGDDQKADIKAIESISVVKGTFTNAGQFQVIIGNDVPIFYNDFTAVSGIEGVSKEAAKSAAKSNQNPVQRVMTTLAEIFTPIIPALIVGGLILGFRNVLEGVHWSMLDGKTITESSQFWSGVNHFYGNEAEVEIPAEYQAGRVLLSNYENVELAEKVILKPYQTLAIYVD